MQSCGGSHHCTLFVSIYRLITLGILLFRLTLDVFGQKRLSELEQSLLEFIMITVIKKSQSAAARSRVVYHLGHHRIVITEIKLVAYAYLAPTLQAHPTTCFQH